MVALRTITLKVIELLNDSKPRGEMSVGSASGDGTSPESLLRSQKWTVGKDILSEIVSVARDIYDGLGFVTFFLSIGRQIEPHQFNLIFPLPSDSSAPSVPLCTAEDLFDRACKLGSLETSLSALPLFSCLEESQRIVTQLIYHCLIRIEENVSSCSSHTGIRSGEDEAFLGQLFWFGVKLEDAIEKEKSYEKEEESESLCSSESSEEDDSFDSSSMASSSTATCEESRVDRDAEELASVSPSVESHVADYVEYSSDESQEVSFSCRTPNKKRVGVTPNKKRVGVIKKMVTKFFPPADPPAAPPANNTEDAINAAASSFVLSGFDDASIKSLPCTPPPALSDPTPSDDNPCDSDGTSDDADTVSVDVPSPATVSGAVGLFISHVIVFGGPHCRHDTTNYGWKACTLVAHLLQGDRVTVDITSACSTNAQTLTQVLVMEDFLAVVRIDNNSRHAVNTEGSSCEAIASWLVHLTSDCCQQIHSTAFGTVFNLVLLLLLRYDTCHDVRLCRATLIGIGIVSGHLSGRTSELLPPSETPCDVNAIYTLYAAKLDAQLV